MQKMRYVTKLLTMIMSRILGYNKENFDYLEKVKFCKSENSKKRLNIYIPNVDKERMFGGQATAMRFFDALAKALDCDTRILSAGIVNNGIVNQYPGYCMINADEDSDFPRVICKLDTSVIRNRRLSVRKGDIFIGTYWTTQYRLGDVQSFFITEFNYCPIMIYLIQDYEPGFYQWGSEHLLIDSTYKGDNILAVFNSKNLKDYFAKNDYSFFKEFYFSPKLNPSLLKILQLHRGENAPRKKQIIIYGRPYVGRNCFSLVVKSLNYFAEMYDPQGEWEYVSAGASFTPIRLSNGKKIRVLGKLSLVEYANTLLESSVGLSLMCSPHPSYPPLEMASFGVTTVTNAFICKELSEFCSDIISVDCVNFTNIAGALYTATKRKHSPVGVNCEESYLAYQDEFDGIIHRISEILA